MYTNIHKSIYLIASGLLLLLSGCSKWLDVEPYDQIDENALLSSEKGFQKLLNGIYIELNDENLYGKALSVEMIEIMGGAYVIGNDAAWSNYKDLSDYKYGTEYWRSRFDLTWNKAYALILNCNKILENMETRKGLFAAGHYNIIRGETLALRAMLHFDMLRLFGPVYSRNPEKTSIPYYTAQTTVPEKPLPAYEVARKVIVDLKEARILLAADPIIENGPMMDIDASVTDKFLCYRSLRLNYYAVTALLARVCLYAGETKDAFTYATDVIRAANAGIFPFVDKSLVTGSPDAPDRIFSSEVIFALTHTSRGQLFKNFFDPGRIPNYVFRMETELMNTYVFGGGTATGGNQDDYRSRVNWIATGANRYFYKYADMAETGKIENTMIPMLRLGEMYLIAAESQSATLDNGISYVNTLRQYRGVPNIQQLNRDVLTYEYIRELYGEGQLFYLYKRLFAPVLFSASASKNPAPSDEIFIVPLPDSETEN